MPDSPQDIRWSNDELDEESWREHRSVLKNFIGVLEKAQLHIATEPATLDNGCSVAGVAPVKDGLVGLDADTGGPTKAWRYKTIDEKPVIINAGAKQTVILPKPPPPPPPLNVTGFEAGDLCEDARAAFPTLNKVLAAPEARRMFIENCCTMPGFYAKWRSKIAAVDRTPATAAEALPAPRDWPPAPKTRQRVVDT